MIISGSISVSSSLCSMLFRFHRAFNRHHPSTLTIIPDISHRVKKKSSLVSITVVQSVALLLCVIDVGENSHHVKTKVIVDVFIRENRDSNNSDSTF